MLRHEISFEYIKLYNLTWEFETVKYLINYNDPNYNFTIIFCLSLTWKHKSVNFCPVLDCGLHVCVNLLLPCSKSMNKYDSGLSLMLPCFFILGLWGKTPALLSPACMHLWVILGKCLERFCHPCFFKRTSLYHLMILKSKIAEWWPFSVFLLWHQNVLSDNFHITPSVETKLYILFLVHSIPHTVCVP